MNGVEHISCSLACLVTGGVHHTQESLLEATLAEIESRVPSTTEGA